MRPKTEVVIVAAGKGKRIKSKVPKPFILLNKKPLIFYSLKAFQNHPRIKNIILVTEKKLISKAQALVKQYEFKKVKKIVAGGQERKDSVINGLQHVEWGSNQILIHDGARPLVTKELITRILDALIKNKAAIPGVAICDTVKLADSKQTVTKTLKRENVYYIQTPQGIRTTILPLFFRNVEKSKDVYDDSMLIEGEIKVKIVDSDLQNIKITTPADLRLAEVYLASQK